MDDLVLFIHIFRAGGSAIWKAFRETLGKRYVRAHTEQLGACPGATHMLEEVIMGHFPFGIHHFIGRPCVYVTMLRDPVDRSVSSYFSGGRGGKNRKLEDYVAAVRRGHGYDVRFNVQLRLLCGHPPDLIREGFYAFMNRDVDEDDLEQAKHNLDSFAFVGLFEHLELSFQTIQKIFGWPTKDLTRENFSFSRPRVSDMPDDVVTTVRQANCLDQQLYEYAKELWNRSLS